MKKPVLAVFRKFVLPVGICLLLVTAAMVGACGPLPLPEIAVPEGSQQKLVVFDVDGTLTPEVFSTSLPREHAADTVVTYAEHGFRVVYLSARFPWFSSRLPDWLNEHGFAEGQVFAAQSIGDNRKPLRFKLAILEGLKQGGWKFAAAYGDTSTDFSAYSEAGIPKERIFALKRKGEDQCEPGSWAECLDGWNEHHSHVAKQLTNLPNDAN